MKKAILTIGLTVAMGAAAVSTAAFADRPATPEESAKIGEILKANGFTTWKKIEFDDDGKFEVDDAVHTDGKVYDVDIRNGAIIKKDLED